MGDSGVGSYTDAQKPAVFGTTYGGITKNNLINNKNNYASGKQIVFSDKSAARGQRTTALITKEAEASNTNKAQSSDNDVEKIKNIKLKNKSEQRASQIKFPYLKIKHIKKQNLANKLVKLALSLAKSNKDRHNTIQNFFLINDPTTIATEVPVYLTNWDVGYYRNQRGFIFSLSNYKTPITGHIDILQIRNGLIHILDYKPKARNQDPTEQLTIYAFSPKQKI